MCSGSDFPGHSVVESSCQAGDRGSTPGSGIFPEEGSSNPLRYSFLENSRDRGAWWATLHGVASSQMIQWLSRQACALQFSSATQPCPTLCDPMDCSMPDFPVHHQFLKLAQASVHRVSDAIQSSYPLSSPSPPVFNLSQHQGLIQGISSNCIRWPKYWSFSFSISPSNEYSGLISFMIDWLDHLAIQGTLKSLLQHHSSKAPILWCSAFFIV